MDVKQIVADTLRTLMGATAAEPYIRAIEKAIDAACVCANGWICEAHPDQPWPHGDCPGPGQLCTNPHCTIGRVTRAELDARREPQKR